MFIQFSTIALLPGKIEHNRIKKSTCVHVLFMVHGIFFLPENI